MREITLKDGTIRQVRAMTRAEMRALKNYGVGSMQCNVPREQFDEFSDVLLATQFPDYPQLAEPDCFRLHLAIIAETYSNEEEEKNLSGSGPNAQTPNGPSTAEHA